MNSRYDVVIVGAGHAGVGLALALGKSDFAGSVALYSDETQVPYERPPLSKTYLTGEDDLSRFVFRDASYWAESPVELHLGERIARIDADDKFVITEEGHRIEYSALVWAAGGRARDLDVVGGTLDGVSALRNLADVDRIKQAIQAKNVQNVVIVGGGFIGLESGAAFRDMGMNVTVLEAQERLLARVTSPVVSRHFANLHQKAGVDLRLSTTLDRFEGSGGVLTGVRLGTGEVIPADLAIVGIGLVPNTELLHAAGAEVSNGVVVDERCMTSLPDVYAIGDVASFESIYAGGQFIRLECVQNATEQAKIVASVLNGKPVPQPVAPWFWSNQYGDKLQTVGIVPGHDEAVLRGDPTSGAFSVIYTLDGKVRAIDSVNRAPDFAQGRALVAAASRVSASQLADTTIPLKNLLKQVAA
jgi:3-phenylpropionate/trans-cinnamate dioxygenase ferredoxin reductase subunit